MAILDGKPVADKIQQEIRLEIERLKSERGLVPGLAVIMAGDDPASQLLREFEEPAGRKAGHPFRAGQVPGKRGRRRDHRAPSRRGTPTR